MIDWEKVFGIKPEGFDELVKYANKELPGMIMGIGSIVDPATAALYLQLGANLWSQEV